MPEHCTHQQEGWDPWERRNRSRHEGRGRSMGVQPQGDTSPIKDGYMRQLSCIHDPSACTRIEKTYSLGADERCVGRSEDEENTGRHFRSS